jgi:hypothetical protein
VVKSSLTGSLEQRFQTKQTLWLGTSAQVGWLIDGNGPRVKAKRPKNGPQTALMMNCDRMVFHNPMSAAYHAQYATPVLSRQQDLRASSGITGRVIVLLNGKHVAISGWKS